MPAGLKKELGLGEPGANGSNQGSTEQADQFKAAFQAKMAKVKPCLHYTAAHGEEAKHNPEASKRDKACAAFQMVLPKIDPTNPSAAQAAIDQVLSAVDKLGSTAQTLKDAVEKAFNAWTDREPDFDDISDKVREMVDWGHDKAEALQKVIQAIAEKANAKQYDESLQGLEGLLGKADPIFEDYTKQREAEGEYDGQLPDLDAQLSRMDEEEEEELLATMQEKKNEIQAEDEEMRSKADEKDYVSAIGQLKALLVKVGEYIAEVAELLKKIADYRAAAEAAMTKTGECRLAANSLPSLKAELAALQPLQAAMETAASAKDYDKGLEAAKALEKAADEYLKKAKKAADEAKKEGEELTKELDALSGVARKEKAREWAHKLTDDQLTALPTSVRNRLMKELNEGGLDDKDKEALHEIYRVPTLDPEYEREMIKTRTEFIEKLQNDPELAEARKNWATMDADKRLEVLRKVAKVHAKTYDHEKIEGVPDFTLVAKPVTDRNSNGVYSPSRGEIGINTVARTDSGHVPKFNDFDRAMDLIAHEAGHRHQQMLAVQVNKTPPDIKPGDPLYEQAVAFELNDKYYASYKEKYGSGPETTPYEVYKNQPQEAASRRSGAALHGAGIGEGHDHDHDHEDEHEH